MAERDDVEVDLLVSGKDEEPKSYFGCTKYQSDKLICWKPKRANMAALLVSDIQLAKTLAKLLAQGKTWDVVHVHEWNAVQVARMARDALGVPMVGTMHLCISQLMMEDSCPSDMQKWDEGEFYLMQQEGHLVVDSDEIILCSNAYEQMARKMFMTDRPINVIYNGIRTEEWCEDKRLAQKVWKHFGLPDDRPVALFVGRIADMKGVREILKAVRRWDNGYCLVMAGEINANTEEDKERWDVTHLLRKTEDKYPERLRWIGFQDDETLRGLYSLAEVGLMPSLHEPFGIVALEFMAMGVPLICTEIGGLKEIVCHKDGAEYAFIIRPSKPGDIHRALKFLRTNPKARKNLKELGLKRAQDFDWSVAAAQTVDIYKKVLRR